MKYFFLLYVFIFPLMVHANSVLPFEYSDTIFKINTQENFEDIIERLNNKDDTWDFINTVCIPVILSLITSFIYIQISPLLPQNKRYRKVRVKIDYNLYTLSEKINSYLYIIMRYHKDYTLNYTDQIIGAELTKEDLIVGLKGKCYYSNHQYTELYDDLLPIAENLMSITNDLHDYINTLYGFSEYMTDDEILLIERVKRITSDFRSISKRDVDYCVDPTLVCRRDIFFEINNLSKELRGKITKTKIRDVQAILSLKSFLYRTHDYKTCIKLINKNLKREEFNKSGYNLFLKKTKACCLYNLGKKNKAIILLKDIIEDSENFCDWHHYDKFGFLEDNDVRAILSEKYGNIKVNNIGISRYINDKKKEKHKNDSKYIYDHIIKRSQGLVKEVDI